MLDRLLKSRGSFLNRSIWARNHYETSFISMSALVYKGTDASDGSIESKIDAWSCSRCSLVSSWYSATHHIWIPHPHTTRYEGVAGTTAWIVDPPQKSTSEFSCPISLHISAAERENKVN